MPNTPLLTVGRALWELLMSRPELRERHATFVGTTEFLLIDDEWKKLDAQVQCLLAGEELSDHEHQTLKTIKASIDALSQSQALSAQSIVEASPGNDRHAT